MKQKETQLYNSAGESPRIQDTDKKEETIASNAGHALLCFVVVVRDHASGGEATQRIPDARRHTTARRRRVFVFVSEREAKGEKTMQMGQKGVKYQGDKKKKRKRQKKKR